MIRSAPLLLGIAIGGFFDGILLHQILQWHHLFSGVEDWNDNVAFLMMTDGVFHLAMFAALIAALWMIWRGKGVGNAVANAAIGFGLWHVIDALLSHWLLGIHRIRDVAVNPLLWDLGWVVVFGLVPIAIGARWLRHPPTGAARFLIPLAIGMGLLNAFPIVRPEGPTIVAFGAGTGFATVLDAADAVDANIVTTDATGQVWALDLPEDAAWWRLYMHGAVMVGRGPAASCLGWTEI